MNISISILNNCVNKGVRVSIDDFGTGLSNLKRFMKLIQTV